MRQLIKNLNLLSIITIILIGCSSNAQVQTKLPVDTKEELTWEKVLTYSKNNLVPDRRVEKTNREWRKLLSPEQFRVTRQAGTERPFTGKYHNSYSSGVYTCTCCGTELFHSDTKFDSGTGWPSYSAPIKDNVIKYKSDTSYGMERVEVECNVCDAHLGHVFDDGPNPTGLRYCINSISLNKIDDTSKNIE